MIKVVNKLISLLVVSSLIFPLLADARAGARIGTGSYRSSVGGFKSGYRSYQGRSYNYRPHTSYRSPYQTTRPTATYRSSGSTGSFVSGLASGLLGAYLYSKLFGTSPTAAGPDQNSPETRLEQQKHGTPEGGSFWRIILLLLVAFFLWRYFRNRQSKAGQHKNISSYFRSKDEKLPKMSLKDFVNLSRPISERNVSTLSQEDHNTFGRLLTEIQYAWAQQDFASLQRLTTAEVYDTFCQIIRENQQQSITTHVAQVKVLDQELEETWQEADRSFARVRLTWSAIDYAVNDSVATDASNYLVEGNRNKPTIITETWTFEKTGNGPWLLAGIES